MDVIEKVRRLLAAAAGGDRFRPGTLKSLLLAEAASCWQQSLGLTSGCCC